MNTSASDPQAAGAPARANLALRDYVQIFDGALSAAFCARMTEAFERSTGSRSRNGRGFMKNLQASSWTELNVSRTADAALVRHFAEQTVTYLGRYNATLGLTLPVPVRTRLEDLRIKHYSATLNDGFQTHFDALDYTSNRYMVFLWYLNDVAVGGETEFCDLGLKVSARAGRLLMFPPYWMFQHAGLPPRSSDKFILSTYMLF